MSIFVIGHQRIILTGVLPIVSTTQQSAKNQIFFNDIGYDLLAAHYDL